MTIARHRPPSVNELARLVGRDYKNVSTDIALLERLGLIRLEHGGEKTKARTPIMPYDEIRVTIDLRGRHEAHTT